MDDGVSVVQMHTTIFPHATTHTPGGSDPLGVKALGGMTSQEIRTVIAESAKQCTSNMPNDIERKVNKGRRSGYCPLGPNGKVQTQYLPEFLLGGAFLCYDTALPGTLPSPTVTPFDLLYPPMPAYLMMAYATVMTPPTGGNITVDICKDDAVLTTLTILSGGTSSGVPWQVSAGVYYFATLSTPLNLKLTRVGAEYPGEYLRVRTICKTYTAND
jgi:hypothetical protein